MAGALSVSDTEGAQARMEEKGALEREFDAVMADRGMVVPLEWRAGTLACYLELKRLTALLRQPRAAESEPAFTFTLEPCRRARPRRDSAKSAV
jgi:hypothetical protein